MKTNTKPAPRREKFTPGPWQYDIGRGANPRFHIQTTGGYQIASTTELDKHSQAFEENAAREANANLIAAAPELLQALVDLRAEIKRVVKFDVRKHFSLMVADVAADKALAKAGGQP